MKKILGIALALFVAVSMFPLASQAAPLNL